MIAQVALSVLLGGIILYALNERSRAPLIGAIAMLTAAIGLDLVWFPSQASWLAAQVGIGRGADLVFYAWVVISLLIMLNLHLKLRAQMELITVLAREIAIANAASPATTK
jgi:hypothetical protein